jgi:hypothetical protein
VQTIANDFIGSFRLAAGKGESPAARRHRL